MEITPKTADFMLLPKPQEFRTKSGTTKSKQFQAQTI